MFTAVFDIQLESQSTSSVEQDGRYILNKLSYDIKNATGSGILTPTVGSQSASLIISDGTNTYKYALNSGNLTLNITPANTTDQLNSVNTTISNLSFLRLSDTALQGRNTITVTFTLDSKVRKRSGVSSETFSFTAGTR
jgi:hypothetical protein